MKAFLLVLMSLSLLAQADDTLAQLNAYKKSEELKVVISRMKAISDYYNGDKLFIEIAGSAAVGAVVIGISTGVITESLINKMAISNGAIPAMMAEVIDQQAERAATRGVIAGAIIGVAGRYAYYNFFTPVAYRDQVKALEEMSSSEAFTLYTQLEAQAQQLRQSINNGQMIK